MFSRLRRVDGYDRVEYPGPPTVDESRADHPSVILSTALKTRSEYTPSSTESDGPNSSNFLTDQSPGESTHECPEVVDTDDTALTKGVGDVRCRLTVDDRGITEFHDLNVIRSVVDTAHHPPIQGVSAMSMI